MEQPSARMIQRQYVVTSGVLTNPFRLNHELDPTRLAVTSQVGIMIINHVTEGTISDHVAWFHPSRSLLLSVPIPYWFKLQVCTRLYRLLSCTSIWRYSAGMLLHSLCSHPSLMHIFHILGCYHVLVCIGLPMII
jgi:hypothetical protein